MATSALPCGCGGHCSPLHRVGTEHPSLGTSTHLRVPGRLRRVRDPPRVSAYGSRGPHRVPDASLQHQGPHKVPDASHGTRVRLGCQSHPRCQGRALDIPGYQTHSGAPAGPVPRPGAPGTVPCGRCQVWATLWSRFCARSKVWSGPGSVAVLGSVLAVRSMPVSGSALRPCCPGSRHVLARCLLQIRVRSCAGSGSRSDAGPWVHGPPWCSPHRG